MFSIFLIVYIVHASMQGGGTGDCTAKSWKICWHDINTQKFKRKTSRSQNRSQLLLFHGKCGRQ